MNQPRRKEKQEKQHRGNGNGNGNGNGPISQQQSHFPNARTQQPSACAWRSGPDLPVVYSEMQQPPPPPPPPPLPLYPGQQQHNFDVGHLSSSHTNSQLQLQPQPQYSYAQHRFDQIFMAKPALPPPPPPLVPQQILRKANPSSPKRPSRKRKPDALQNTETEHSNHPRDQREEKHDRHKIKVPRAINLTLSLQNQQNDSRMVSQQDSNQEGSTSFNVIHSSENFQVADPEYYDNGKSERESSDNLSSTATDAESFGQIKDAGEIANKKSESRKKLELLKAKLELAKQKKLAMQGELKQTNPTDSESPKISEAKKNPEVQAALKRAREKLRGALTSRERALQRTSPVQTPISGLCVSLIIRNISQTGPQSLVRFPTEGFGLDLGRKALEELSDRDSLASRKSQLQQELMALKNLLERKQGSTELEEDGNDSQGDDAAKGITSSPVTKQIMTKEELERRKEEAQAIMDLSYWKHFVSKQEHMMAEVDGQVHENSKALNECSIEIEDAVRNLQESELHILDLEKRQQAVAQMVSNATAKLLETRKKLHLEKAKEPAVN